MCAVKYEVHRNTTTEWVVLSVHRLKKSAIRSAESEAKASRGKGKDVSFGVFDTVKGHYIGFASIPGDER